MGENQEAGLGKRRARIEKSDGSSDVTTSHVTHGKPPRSRAPRGGILPRRSKRQTTFGRKTGRIRLVPGRLSRRTVRLEGMQGNELSTDRCSSETPVVSFRNGLGSSVTELVTSNNSPASTHHSINQAISAESKRSTFGVRVRTRC